MSSRDELLAPFGRSPKSTRLANIGNKILGRGRGRGRRRGRGRGQGEGRGGREGGKKIDRERERGMEGSKVTRVSYKILH